MKLATNDVQIIRHEGHFVGVSLGHSFCAEHEFGTKGIQERFGIPQKPTFELLGFEKRKVQTFPEENLGYHSEGNTEYLYFHAHGWEWLVEDLPLVLPGDKQLVTAWDESNFGIKYTNKDNKKALATLYHAFKDLNVVFFRSPSMALGGRGLNICMYNRIPKEFLQKSREADLKYIQLLREAEKTGIEERLRRAQRNLPKEDSNTPACSWFALSPRWKPEDMESKYPVVFWLNPRGQHRNNFGLFTVEDLDQWTLGEGPIPK